MISSIFRPCCRATRTTSSLAFAFIACLLALAASSAQANCGTTPLAHEDAFRVSAIPLNDRSLEVRVAIEPCYYLYQSKLSFTLEPNVLGQVALPVGERKSDPFMGDVSIYRKDVAITLPFTSPLPRGSSYTLKVNYQGCAESIGLCYPPAAQMLTLNVPKAAIPGDEVFARPPKKKWF